MQTLPIEVIQIQKVVLLQSYKQQVTLSLNYFKNSKVWQIEGGKFCGTILTKDKHKAINIFNKKKQIIDRLNVNFLLKNYSSKIF